MFKLSIAGITIPTYLVMVLVVFVMSSSSAKAQLISYEKIDSFSKERLKEVWKENGVPKIVAPIKHGVDVYDIIYTTTYDDEIQVKASGLYFIPTNVDPATTIPMLVYNHGTTTKPQRHIDYNGESTICLMFATDGYGVVHPDYVGLGHGEGVHLYHHADSEANAGKDLLKVCKQLNSDFGVQHNAQLFITGYSQGGHSTMALHRKLEQDNDPDLQVTASSPMSGAYDILITQNSVMFEEYTQPHYLPYLLRGFNTYYGFYSEEEFYDVFVPPYNETIPQLLDGTHDVEEVNEALPSVPKDMIKPELVDAYVNDPDFFLLEPLAENCVYDWKPKAPVQLCYCKADEEVKYENALVAHETMTENGAENVRLMHVGKKFNHYDCAGFAVVHTKFFFNSFRKGSKKGRKGPVFKRMLLNIAKVFS